MRISAILFDLDGTLLDTIPDLAQAVNAMRADLGRAALPQERVAAFVGKGIRRLVLRTLEHDGESPDEARIQACLERFKHHYRQSNGLRAIRYPGVTEGLDAFQRMGLKLAVVTNKSTEFTLPLLERTGLAPYFEQVVCGDTCPEPKPHPMPLLHACSRLGTPAQQALMVGDSINDTQAARAAGMPVLAVPYGYNEGQGVQNLDADAIVVSIDAAAQWVHRRLGHSNAQTA